MTQAEHAELCDLLKDLFPFAKWTDARFGVVWRVFNRYPIHDVRAAWTRYAEENPDQLRPNFERIKEILTAAAGTVYVDPLKTIADHQRARCVREARDQGDIQWANYWETAATQDDVLDEYDKRACKYARSQGREPTRFDLSRPWKEPLTPEEDAAASQWRSDIREKKIGDKLFSDESPIHKRGEPLNDDDADRLRDLVNLYKGAAVRKTETIEERAEREAREDRAEKIHARPKKAGDWTQDTFWITLGKKRIQRINDGCWVSPHGTVMLTERNGATGWFGWPLEYHDAVVGPHDTVGAAMAETEKTAQRLLAMKSRSKIYTDDDLRAIQAKRTPLEVE